LPTYDFVCPECGYRWEVVKHMQDPNPAQCLNPARFERDGAGRVSAHCAGVPQRVWAPMDVHYKGSGFVTTDKGLDKKVAGYDYDEYDERTTGE